MRLVQSSTVSCPSLRLPLPCNAMPDAFPFVVELVSISVACRGLRCGKSRSAFLVATLITETTDELIAREAIRLAARLQHLCFGNPGGLALNTRCNFLRPWYTRPFTASTESPKTRATSFVDNSPRSRSSIAARIPGVSLSLAADRIRLRSPSKKRHSGPAHESGLSSPSEGSSLPPKSSIDTSRLPRPRRSNTRASLIAIRVNHVEQQHSPPTFS